MKALPDFDALLGPIRAAVKELPREALPSLYGALATLQAEILLVPPAAAAPGETTDRALDAAAVADELGRSRDWVYRNRHSLPLTRLPSGRWTVSSSRLRKWKETRTRQS